ncbi:MAG: aminotransferase class V-fold PLP-dependent enzyme, partial [Oscillospiraceae bacterium]|nr:aminotransferase class V-fold PLP-dependent enzyme [Oscillospiraceae bacterium]
MQGYFDHAATTLIDPKVAKRVYDAMLEFPGNPSSSHRLGMQAAVMLKKARAGIASL